MACPFFHPRARFEDGAWVRPPRLPLGDPCVGECTASADGPVSPDIAELRILCNSGYARERCERFPARSDAPDAIRFSVERDEPGSIEVMYIEEREYAPVRFGTLRYQTSAGCFLEQAASANMEAQARMYVASYLSRRATP